ncbi:unnamed protein product [Chrysoparadoxa australica]
MSIRQEVVGHLKIGLPPSKLCSRLGKNNPDICATVRDVATVEKEEFGWVQPPPRLRSTALRRSDTEQKKAVENDKNDEDVLGRAVVEHRTSFPPTWVMLE